MKKKLIFAIPVLALILLTSWIVYTHSERKNLPLICESNHLLTTYWQYDKNTPITVNTDVFISLTDSENGVLSVNGTVERKGNLYILSRRVNYHTSPMMLNGMRKITFTKETAHLVDNTPDEIWQKYFIPEKIGVEFYVEVTMLNDNTMYLKGFSNPYNICVIKG